VGIVIQLSKAHFPFWIGFIFQTKFWIIPFVGIQF